MKDFFEALAATNGWAFDYARADFHNLYDGVADDTVLLMLDPLTSNEALGERGDTQSINWQGTLLLCLNSSIDEIDYNERYKKYIQPLTAGAYQTLKAALKCSNTFTLISAQTTEIINTLDLNCDGLSVSFTIREDV